MKEWDGENWLAFFVVSNVISSMVAIVWGEKKEKIYQRAKNIVHDIWVIRDWNCSSLLNLSDENKKKRLNVASIFVIVFLFVTFYISSSFLYFFLFSKNENPFLSFIFIHTIYIFCAVQGCNFHFEDDVCFQKQEKVGNEIV